MHAKKFLIFCCLFLFSKLYSENSSGRQIYFVLDSLAYSTDSMITAEVFTATTEKRPTPLLQRFRIKEKKNKKLLSALLAFPLPFGIVGLHRIYLGSAPYVPVVYIASFGGALGLLPLIDFCFILLDKNIIAYENNKKVFMWVK